MKPRCELGDLAVVIRGSCCGAFVHVRRVGPYHPVDHTWYCTAATPLEVEKITPTGRSLGHGIARAGEYIVFMDSDLQPIRPPKPPQTTPAPPVELEN